MSPSSSRSLTDGASSTASSTASRTSSSSVISTSCWLTTGPPTVLACCSTLARPLASRLSHRLLPHHLADRPLRFWLRLRLGLGPAQPEQDPLDRAVLAVGRTW